MKRQQVNTIFTELQNVARLDLRCCLSGFALDLG